MLFFGFSAGFEAGGKYRVADGGYLVPGEQFFVVAPDDFGYLAPVDYCGVLRFDFEVGFFGECDYGEVGQGFVFVEHSFQCPDMPVVLEYRVVQFVLGAVDVLCPVFSAFVAIYSTAVILRFDHEDAVDRNHQLVNLGASVIADISGKSAMALRILLRFKGGNLPPYRGG